jgi:hypothetical protein
MVKVMNTTGYVSGGSGLNLPGDPNLSLDFTPAQVKERDSIPPTNLTASLNERQAKISSRKDMAVPSNAKRPQNNSAMTELKYRRIADLNQKLRDDYDRPRCKTSDACNKYLISPSSLIIPFRSPLILEHSLYCLKAADRV